MKDIDSILKSLAKLVKDEGRLKQDLEEATENFKDNQRQTIKLGKQIRDLYWGGKLTKEQEDIFFEMQINNSTLLGIPFRKPESLMANKPGVVDLPHDSKIPPDFWRPIK